MAAWRDRGGAVHVRFRTYENPRVSLPLAPSLGIDVWPWEIVDKEVEAEDPYAIDWEALRSPFDYTRTWLTAHRAKFEAVARAMEEPIRYEWSLDDQPMKGKGETKVFSGSVEHDVAGAVCRLRTELGQDLCATLTVVATDSAGLALTARTRLLVWGRTTARRRVEAPEIPMAVESVAVSREPLAAGEVAVRTERIQAGLGHLAALLAEPETVPAAPASPEPAPDAVIRQAIERGMGVKLE